MKLPVKHSIFNSIAEVYKDTFDFLYTVSVGIIIFITSPIWVGPYIVYRYLDENHICRWFRIRTGDHTNTTSMSEHFNVLNPYSDIRPYKTVTIRYKPWKRIGKYTIFKFHVVESERY